MSRSIMLRLRVAPNARIAGASIHSVLMYTGLWTLQQRSRAIFIATNESYETQRIHDVLANE